jgi:hypothetical protein
VVAAILRIRDDPPEHLQRVPGPRALLYYLARDPELAGNLCPARRARSGASCAARGGSLGRLPTP